MDNDKESTQPRNGQITWDADTAKTKLTAGIAGKIVDRMAADIEKQTLDEGTPIVPKFKVTFRGHTMYCTSEDDASCAHAAMYALAQVSGVILARKLIDGDVDDLLKK